MTLYCGVSQLICPMIKSENVQKRFNISTAMEYNTLSQEHAFDVSKVTFEFGTLSFYLHINKCMSCNHTCLFCLLF